MKHLNNITDTEKEISYGNRSTKTRKIKGDKKMSNFLRQTKDRVLGD